MSHFVRLMIVGISFAPLWMTPAAAAVINGSFETGTLAGWETLGDVSIQQAGIGITPTDGSHQAVITTLCGDGTSISGSYGCQITATERPYSGINALYTALSCYDFDALGNCIGAPVGTPGMEVIHFVGLTPADLIDDFNVNGEGSAIRQGFHANAGDTVSIDYNYVGEYEWGFLTLFSTDPVSTLRIVERAPLQTLPSNMHLCERVEGNSPAGNQCPNPWNSVETGFRHFSYQLASAGNYQIGLAVFEVEEGTVPSAMVIDNLRVSPVPIPTAFWLFGSAVGVMGWLRRKRS